MVGYLASPLAVVAAETAVAVAAAVVVVEESEAVEVAVEGLAVIVGVEKLVEEVGKLAELESVAAEAVVLCGFGQRAFSSSGLDFAALVASLPDLADFVVRTSCVALVGACFVGAEGSYGQDDSDGPEAVAYGSSSLLDFAYLSLAAALPVSEQD